MELLVNLCVILSTGFAFVYLGYVILHPEKF